MPFAALRKHIPYTTSTRWEYLSRVRGPDDDFSPAFRHAHAFGTLTVIHCQVHVISRCFHDGLCQVDWRLTTLAATIESCAWYVIFFGVSSSQSSPDDMNSNSASFCCTMRLHLSTHECLPSDALNGMSTAVLDEDGIEPVFRIASCI